MPYKTPNLSQLLQKGKKFIPLGIFIVAMTFTFSLMNKHLTDFSASVIPTKTAAPFDGTALPVNKEAKWTALTASERAMDYDQLPADKLIPLPVYNPDQLKISSDKLGWKSEQDLAIRNAKITFSTPYMGDYKLDGIEYAGSHLAIDIKIPMKTPIHAIGNGVVVKVADQTTGFGKHIVIKHENFPSFEDPNKKVTLYSSYNHLNETLVAEGQVVKKGELIAKSGQSGLASTPHLHFQIDNDSAPWHPFWPFTSQEAANAGVSFNDAVNTGLGKDKALKTTINPMLYVQKYLNGAPSNANQIPPTPVNVDQTPSSPTPANPSSDQPQIDQIPPQPENTPITNEIPSPIIEENNHNSAPEEIPTIDPIAEPPSSPTTEPAVGFKIEHDGAFVVGAAEKISIQAIDKNGDRVKNYKPEDRVYVKVVLGGADVPEAINTNDFNDGEAVFSLIPKSTVGIQIKVTDMKISGESEVMVSNLFSDLDENSSTYKQIQVLKKYGVVGGYPDGTFQPTRVVSRAEALKLIVIGSRLNVKKPEKGTKLPFYDLNLAEWYGDYVATAYQKKIVAGYSDNSFKPGNTVNKAEFTKMLLLALNIPVPEKITKSSYKNVSNNDWFAPYIEVANKKNLFSENTVTFDAEKGMTREEVASMIYRAVMLKASGAEAYDNGTVVAGNKLNKYFGVY